MRTRLELLEREVERRMSALRALPTPAPVGTSLQRLKAAVRSEASRVRSRKRMAWKLGQAGAAVAAVVLAAFLARPASPTIDPARQLDEWALAAAESSDALAALVLEGHLPSDYSAYDDAAEMQDLLESLDEALEIGA